MNARSTTPTVSNITVLVDIRRDLEALLHRVNTALSEMEEAIRPQGPTAKQMSVTQTIPSELDFRDNPEALRKALVETYDQIISISHGYATHPDQKALHRQMCSLAAKIRLLQYQSEEGSREWETAVGAIRTLTRIASDTRAGYVYGLATSHNTDWGQLYLSLHQE